MKRRAPLLTLLLCTLAGSLMVLPSILHSALYFNYNQVLNGIWLTLITGHWMHTDIHHLAWNVSALAILGSIIEARSRALLLWSIVVGMFCVDLLLLSSYSDLQRYCGLSGLLNTLLGVALYLLWRDTRSLMVVFTGILCIGKIALEMYSGQSIFTEIAWPPFAPAHLAGFIGAPLALLLVKMTKHVVSHLNINKGVHYEHLVSS